MNPDLAPAAARLPSGTVTFAFTDIEGSTQRWERNRAAMQAAVRRHDELMRAAVGECGGHVFKTVGDAFCLAFARPEDAVAAMLVAQRALAAEDFASVDGLRVRAAIHTGTADERDGDYFGPAVNRVARLLAIGHGGQILVSGVSADLVHGHLPPQASLRDLGKHRLRDLARPEYVHQLVAPGLTADFPPLRSLDALPNNLPRTLSTLVGRETEIAEIVALIETNPLVTLVGSGGLGKTRTALQVAANLLDGSGDGVWFIELAPLTSGDYIVPAVAQALGITLAGEGDPLDNLARALKKMRTLLIFDNCEHLVEPASQVIAALLRGCPQLRVLATSRQGLGITAEATYRMPSLGVPAANKDASPVEASDAARYAAIALFVERARAADNRFRLTDENAPIVADICRRLDGIPLAIELAASRVKILSPRQLRDRLDERFRVLTGGSRDVLPRQQTLRALIDWSHDLLDDRERALFRRLGIFVNGFTLEGAVAVGSGDDIDELDVFDIVASLVDKSLVLAEPDGESLRYRFLESTRAYAVDKLANAGETNLIAQRHLGYLCDYFAEVEARRQQTARESEHERVFAAEIEDVRAALDFASTQSDALRAGALLADIGNAWTNLGLGTEAIARIERVLPEIPPPEALLLSRLTLALSWLLTFALRTDRSRAVVDQSVAYARASGSSAAVAAALAWASWIYCTMHRLDEAESLVAEAEAIVDASPCVRLHVLRCRAWLERGEESELIWERVSKEHRALGNAQAEFSATMNLAETYHFRDKTARAIAVSRNLLNLRNVVATNRYANALVNLAGYCVAQDDIAEARAASREMTALIGARDPERTLVATGIEHFALACALDGDLARAARLAGYADAVLQRDGFVREFTEVTTRDRLVAILQAGCDPDELTRLTGEGAGLAPEAAVALVLENP